MILTTKDAIEILGQEVMNQMRDAVVKTLVETPEDRNKRVLREGLDSWLVNRCQPRED
jgi:hypothetical protein